MLVSRSYGLILSNPKRIEASYFTMLKLERADVAWGRLWQIPNGDEIAKLQQVGCSCHLDPTTLCSKHKCSCKLCKKGTRVCGINTQF